MLDPRYLRLLWQRRWLIAACVIVFLALGALQVKRSTPVYTSKAVLKYEPATAQIVNFGGERSTILYQRDEIKTAVELIKNPSLADAVLKSLGGPVSQQLEDSSPIASARDFLWNALSFLRSQIVSYEAPSIDQKLAGEQSAAMALLSKITVTQRLDTKLIEIFVRSNDPTRAARIADEFCNQFIESISRERNERFVVSRAFFMQQIDLTKARLEQAEKELFDLSGQSDLRVMTESRNIAIETLTNLSSEIERQKNELALLEAESKATDVETARALILSDSELFRKLVDRRVEALVEKIKLESINEPDFQPLVLRKKEIEAIDQQLEDAASQTQKAKAGKLAIARMKLESLQHRLVEAQDRVNQIENEMVPYRLKQREIEAAREIFNAVLTQSKQLEVNDEGKLSNVTVVSRATIPTFPTSPNVTRTLALFALFGLFCGAGIVLTLNWFDRSVKDPAQVEALLELPSIGFVPFMKVTRNGGLFRSSKAGRPVVLLEPESKKTEAEAFRYLRTSVQYSSADHPPQVLLVTSCFPQEGKSTVSANLSILFAERGQKTLLIDADLKRPSVHKIFQITKMPGLSDVLTGQCELENAIVRSEQYNLDILPAGLPTPSPITLLESQAMSDLIGSLRSRYTTIILDSAPAHGMADALVLVTRVDGTVLVVKQGSTLTEVLVRTVEKLRSIGGNLIGAVYNSTHKGRGATGSTYGYGYGYGYSYRYDQESGDESEKELASSAGNRKS